MAITNAQQYQQLVNKPADGKRPGYRGDAAYASKSEQSAKSVGGQGQTAAERGDPAGSTRDYGENYGSTPNTVDGTTSGNTVIYNPDKALEKTNFQISLENDRIKREARKAKLKERTFLQNLGKLGYTVRTKDENLVDLGAIDPQTMSIAGYEVPSILSGITSSVTVDPSTQYFDIDSPREIASTIKGGITGTQAKTLADLRQDIQMEDRLNDPNDRVTQSEFEEYMNRNKVILPEGGGNDQPIIPLTPYQQDVAQEEVDPNSLQALLANRIAYRFMADGGRAGFAEGGMPYEGGIMDLESARQMYGLGKLVKKATSAIGKIVKSPVGKAALLAGGAGLFGFGPAKGLFASGKGLGFKDFLTRSFLGKEVSGGDLSGRGRTGGIFQFMKDNPLLTIAGGSALAGLFAGQDEEDEVQPYYRGPGLDIAAIRRDPYAARGAAYGFYAEGGDVKEPVAKETMPLLDMKGMEKDYRADGGFVPIGRMERADDVPARLSKNEFVFTADAVRNAGDGDIDKGAEVMYNVMKNLEAGGNISEESQGLNGARDMFQTSKRLEEVL